MEDIIIKEAIQQGLWATLFVSLYLYQLSQARENDKRSQSREDKLTTFITDMSRQFETLTRSYERLSEDVKDIRDKLRDK